MNRRLILNFIRQHGPKSRAELVIATGLSAAALTSVVSDLIRESIVTEGNTVAGSTGRRPVPIQIDYDRGVALGFKLMADAIECVAADLATTVIATMRVPLAAKADGAYVCPSRWPVHANRGRLDGCT